jgi:hypothetical protein
MHRVVMHLAHAAFKASQENIAHTGAGASLVQLEYVTVWSWHVIYLWRPGGVRGVVTVVK